MRKYRISKTTAVLAKMYEESFRDKELAERAADEALAEGDYNLIFAFLVEMDKESFRDEEKAKEAARQAFKKYKRHVPGGDNWCEIALLLRDGRLFLLNDEDEEEKWPVDLGLGSVPAEERWAWAEDLALLRVVQEMDMLIHPSLDAFLTEDTQRLNLASFIIFDLEKIIKKPVSTARSKYYRKSGGTRLGPYDLIFPLIKTIEKKIPTILSKWYKAGIGANPGLYDPAIPLWKPTDQWQHRRDLAKLYEAYLNSTLPPFTEMSSVTPDDRYPAIDLTESDELTEAGILFMGICDDDIEEDEEDLEVLEEKCRRLVTACKMAVRMLDGMVGDYDWVAEPLAELRLAIAEAEGE